MNLAPVGILGTGSYLPSRVVTNEDLEAPTGVTDEWIVRKTGIRARRFGKHDEATSDLAAAAARAALEDSGSRVADLTLIIVATSTPDSPQPPTAALVAHLLDAPSTAAAFDLNAVCSGFVYALAAAQRMLAATGGTALVIGADMYSRITDPADRRTRVLFGDGAGAVVLGGADRRRILASRLLTYAEGRELVGVPAGGTRLGVNAGTVDEGRHHFVMNGRGVKEIVYDKLPGTLFAFLDEAGVAKEDIAHIVPHQGNGVMLGDLERELAFPQARLHTTVGEYGNTGAASIPVTLDAAARAGQLRPGDKVLLTAFGGGFSFGHALVEW
ncbi:3-oxoacyl-ACP synthase III family protein [Streptomyces acidiscabies]|uniref:Ketoacyl-ACP synthase III n=2 Tax=Streptomyces acidiscabies TaxID=42234 RepID=A0AAP6BFN0_9ACTN|nr:ketoacyl-ACP synthase III [Streptomyces acidiscabies]MBP5941127.1 ketoacyl-ACP synthase III [Streptomyces sp. LBUM 1476]MBZ3912447.1 ketoacyl-ACP synthase III [Streptomyces acidiscabies]MDX2963760.1 ketoacyl-ACP synthase III [Streptomyces acidiscabies]MDX3021591.1 ketoacyl-ACP synthase III [Streptomyces acidiscabies]MDX3793858.1 ketoacyl-ACP synthase III [Streptomyces acidiscabies]